MRTIAVLLMLATAMILTRENGLAQMMEPNKKFLEAHIRKIVGERTPHSSDQHLSEVFSYIRDTLQSLGYEINIHPFSFQGEEFENIIARKKGNTTTKRIILAAHFDSVPGSPGADDNASGVASMLELARVLATRKWQHTVEFVGFHMEEWNMIGSSAYARKLKEEKVEISGMISLEMVGYATDKPNSQKMPLGFGLFYPDAGNFIGLVSNVRSRKLLNLFKSTMKQIDGLNVESLIMPLNGILLAPTRWSDHSPFWDSGYPALMVTDTSFYRNPHYHSPTDTIETLDLDFMQKVTAGVGQALVALDQQ